MLGQSFNNFVIFDTPGSNSASNAEHSKVLAEALEGFSNGIPVWISTYESIDSTDNGKLCDDILEIKALDKRFTIGEELVYWLENGCYKQDGIVVEGYSAEKIAALSKYYDGEAAFIMLIQLREKPEMAKKQLIRGFKMK